MPQTLEPGTKASTAKGKRTGGDGPQTTNAEQRSLGIRRPNGADSLRRLDSIRNSCSAGPVPKYGGSKVGIPGVMAPEEPVLDVISMIVD